MMKLLSLDFPLTPDIMTTVRLVTGGVCALVGFGIDDAEDCKVCVTESLLMLLHGGAASASLRFDRGDSLKISLEAENASKASDEAEISIALLNALVDDLVISTEKSHTRISFGFGKL